MQNKKWKKTLAYVQWMHHGQHRAGKVPVWHHLVHVSQILDFVLNATNEGSSREHNTIVIAALGHDILEDTNATKKEVLRVFGRDGLFVIEGMTNSWGDRYKKSYIKQMVRSPESVRLIKLSDLYDNITSALYNFDRLGLKWMTSYFLPIVTPMRKAVAKTKFKKYQKSAALLLLMVENSARLLDYETRIVKRKPKH